MFGNKARRHAFEREVSLEIEILRKLHGEDAHRVAVEKADRPTNRTARRKVLEETVRRLSPGGGEAAPVQKGLLGRLFGG